MSKEWKIALIILLSLGAITGITLAIRGGVKRNERKLACQDRGLEGADLTACMKQLKREGKMADQEDYSAGEITPVADTPIVTTPPFTPPTVLNTNLNDLMSSGTNVFPLKYGSRGMQVSVVQNAFNATYPSERITADGIWGNDTENAAKKLLAKVGITGKPVISKAIYDKYFKRYE